MTSHASADAAPRRWPRAIAAVRELLLPAGKAWPWAPVALAAAYSVLLLATLPSVVRAIYVGGDTVAAPYVVELYARAGAHGTVTLGDIPWYTAFWFEWLTRGLPGYRTLWELAPWVTTLVGIAILSWSTVRVAGRWAGMIVAVVLGCAGAALLPLQFSWSIHAMAYVHVCVLGAFAVLLAGTSGLIGGKNLTHVVALTVVAVFTGAGLASDPLVGVAGLAPFVVAGGAVAWLSSGDVARRIVGSVLAVALVSVIVAWLVSMAMTAAGIVAFPFGIAFSPFNQLAKHVGLLWESVTVLLNGDFGGVGIGASGILAFACAAAVAAAAYASARYARSWIMTLPRSRHVDDLLTSRDAARTAYLTFWIASAVILSAAFALSTVPVDIENKRYVVTVAYAIVAVVAVAAEPMRWARGLATLGACAILAGSIAAVLHRDIQQGLSQYPGAGPAGQLRLVTQREHLRYGYAGYWDAGALTWQMNSAAEVYPVSACDSGKALCPFAFHRISTWYRPRANTRTFLVIDSSQAAANGFATPPASLGKPGQTVTVGRLTVYVYPYDIASRFRAS